MSEASHFPRRSFLYGSALVAGTVTLSACSSDKKKTGGGGGKTSSGAPSSDASGSSAPSKSSGGTGGGGGKDQGSNTTMPKPAKFTESPSLAALVKSGKIPAVDKRLPPTRT